MTKKQLTTVMNVFKKVSKQYGLEGSITLNDSPMNAKSQAVYIDGEIVTEYWGYGYTGWNFQNSVHKELDKRGLWVEAYTETIFDAYTK